MAGGDGRRRRRASASHGCCPSSTGGSTSFPTPSGGSAAGRRPVRPEPPVRAAPRPLRRPLRHQRQRRPVRGQAASGSAASSRRSGTRPDPLDEAHIIGALAGIRDRRQSQHRGLRHDPQDAAANGPRRISPSTSAACRRERPVVLMLEDLHWADEATLALIDAADAVLQRPPDPRGRHDAAAAARAPPPLGRGSRLPRAAAPRARCRDARRRRLLAEILQRADARAPCAQPISSSTAVGRQSRSTSRSWSTWLLEAGVITKDDDGVARARAAARTGASPATLRSVLQARLDALSEARAPGAAAGIGDRPGVLGPRRRSWVDGDRPAGRSDSPMAVALDRLASAGGRVRARTLGVRPDTGSSSSSTPCCATSTYDGVLRRHRQTYHGLAARWFEQMVERTRRADEYAA